MDHAFLFMPPCPCQDAVFRDILQHGYEWTVISHQAVEKIPRLPHFLQQALNATNTAAAAQSELEVMSLGAYKSYTSPCSCVHIFIISFVVMLHFLLCSSAWHHDSNLVE